MLTTHMNGQELGLILGKQLLSSLQTLFRLIGPELNLITSIRGCRIKATNNGVAARFVYTFKNQQFVYILSKNLFTFFSNVCAIFEDTLQRCKSLPPPLNGVELARFVNTFVRCLFTFFVMCLFTF